MLKETLDLSVFTGMAHKTSEERLFYLAEICKEKGYTARILRKKNGETPFSDVYRDYNLETRNLVVWANPMDDTHSTRILTAHYDIVNASSENANDNTAGVAVLLKYLEKGRFPSDKNIVVVFTDKEETGGKGARLISEFISKEALGKIEFILNLDAVGCGDHLIAENNESPLGEKLVPLVKEFRSLPFNDAVIFRREKIDSVCLCIGGKNYGPWSTMHSEQDKIENLNWSLMGEVLQTVEQIAKK